jgi:sorting nexin-7/30/sorting nexin-8
MIIKNRKTPYEKFVKCFLFETNELVENKVKLSIKLSDPKKNPGGLFTTSYTTYLVVTEPLNYAVRRRFSDFEWLRELLVNHLPGKHISPLPRKKYSDRFQESFVLKRQRFLEVKRRY